MAIKKSIGKNTLGGGNKMNVYLHEYSRSTHDLSCVVRTDQSPGTLVPVFTLLQLPGDTFEVDMRKVTMTAPTIGPMLGSFKQQTDFFFCPIRLYNALLHNNTLNIGLDMKQVKLPKLSIDFSTNAGKDKEWLEGSGETIRKRVNPSCLLAYLGIRDTSSASSTTSATSKTNAVKILAYYDIFKNYYANKQESTFYTIGSKAVETAATTIIQTGVRNTSGTYVLKNSLTFTLGTGEEILAIGLRTDTDIYRNREIAQIILDDGKTYTLKDLVRTTPVAFTGGEGIQFAILTATIVSSEMLNGKTISKIIANPIAINSWDLTDIDEVREKILMQGRNEYIISKNSGDTFEGYLKQFAERDGNGYLKTINPQFGLALKTYQSDIFTNWVKTEWIDGDNGINAITAIDTSSGEFTLDTLNLAQKVYDMLNRIAVSDGSYNSWIETVYTVGGVPHYETPVYIGGSSNEIEFQEVISNAAAEDQPLGTLAGRGITTNFKGGTIKYKVDEPGYIIAINSITPRVDYCQANDFDVYFNTLDDLHKPQLDGIGFQDRIWRQIAGASIGDWTSANKSIGKQPAWIDYMTNYNRTFGNFALLENKGWMCLNRYFTTLAEYTTYIEPDRFNYIFADTDINAMNFWCQIAFNVKNRRVMSAKQIPNL